MRKFIKYTVYFLLTIFVLISVTPYFFSVNEIKFNSEKLPFSNSRFLDFKGMQIHYRVWKPSGEIKQKAFLIHGFSGSTFCYRKSTDTLVKQGVLVVAVDLPGFGYSEKINLDNFEANSTTEIIDEIIKLNDNEVKSSLAWLILGHSMGASVAAKYANVHPEKIDKLVMMDGLSGLGPSSGSMIFLYPPLGRWAEVLLKHKLSTFESFKGLLSSAYSEEAKDEDVNGYREPFLFQGSGSAIFKVMSKGNKVEKKYSGETLVIWGKNDQWIPIENAYSYLSKNKGSYFFPIDGAGHCCMETKPEEVNKVLSYFIQRKP